jgi:predicted dehydrogenase
VGCGNVSEKHHLPALQSVKGIEVIALADANKERLARIADRFQILKRYEHYRSLVDDPAVDAVGIITPVQFHAEMALAAMDAGKHFFLEKPLTLRLDPANELIERAARAHCRVMVGFNLRWHRLVRQAREIIQNGMLGPIELALSVSTTGTRCNPHAPEWMSRRELGGGVLFEYAGHFFDLWRFLFQDELKQIFALSRSEKWDDVSATVIAHMRNGVSVTSIFSESTSTNKEIQIYGQNGSLHISLYRFDGLGFIPRSSLPGDIETRLREIVHTIGQIPRAFSSRKRGGDHGASFAAEWQHFADCIKQNAKPECTLEDGRKALQAIVAALESAGTGKPVYLADV